MESDVGEKPRHSYLRAVREIATARNETVGLCHGCFDIIHSGHIHYLQQAAKAVDVLVVSLTAARWIDKGPGRPVFDDDKRAYLMRSLEMVDHVFLEDSATAVPVIEALQPDKYFKGREYVDAEDVRIEEERRITESYGGSIVFTDDSIRDSSTRIARHVMQDAHK